MAEVKNRRQSGGGAPQDVRCNQSNPFVGWMLKVFILLHISLTILPAYRGSFALGATNAEIDNAIEEGLARLAATQQPDGFWTGSRNYRLAATAASVHAFENEGHFPSGGTLYSSNVEKGLDWIFTTCYKQPITAQAHGDPDSNGNGNGIFFSYSSRMYEIGIVIPAIVASNTPDRTVTTGTHCQGMTYREVIQDAVDYIAWAQNDAGTGRGGWDYTPNSVRGDNSVAQWPVLGLIAAEQWGINAPDFVKDELDIWVKYIQSSNGGSGYSHPNHYVNVGKTGGLLVEQHYLGWASTSPLAVKARNFINDRWNRALGGWYGNKGHPYAMFAVFKGLELMEIEEMSNAPANNETSAGDWWGDYAEYLVYTQQTSGSWNGYSVWPDYLATPWYIMILQATVFPVSVNVEVPDIACDNDFHIDIQYAVERYEANGTVEVYREGDLYDTVILNNFMDSATKTYHLTEAPIGDQTWRAVLEATGGGITATAEDVDNGEVVDAPIVAGIADQVMPFMPINLDEHVTCDCNCSDIEWSYNMSGNSSNWTVVIDDDTHVATVTPPAAATVPVDITFHAVMEYNGVPCDGEDTATFTPNQPPVAHPGKLYPDEKYYVDEGSMITLNGTQSYDPDGTIVSYEWEVFFDTGPEILTGAEPIFSAVDLDGEMEVYVDLTVYDNLGASSTSTAEVEVLNVAPQFVGMMTLDPPHPCEVDTTYNIGATFSDPCVADQHTAECDWGDSSSSNALVYDDPSSEMGTISANHSYDECGVYTIHCNVTDDDGDTSEPLYHHYAMAYDHKCGFVTGGGWIQSPAGAYKRDESLSGKASFGFVSKYIRRRCKTKKECMRRPFGQTNFHFHARRFHAGWPWRHGCNLRFRSTSYDVLVVADHKAMFMGSGKINHRGNYGFMLSIIDARHTSSTDVDLFRIKIWDKDAVVDGVIYDNGAGNIDADPVTALGGGNIAIHKHYHLKG